MNIKHVQVLVQKKDDNNRVFCIDLESVCHMRVFPNFLVLTAIPSMFHFALTAIRSSFETIFRSSLLMSNGAFFAGSSYSVDKATSRDFEASTICS